MFAWLQKLLGLQPSPVSPLLAEVLSRHRLPGGWHLVVLDLPWSPGQVSRLALVRPDGCQVCILEPSEITRFTAPFSDN